jgi:FkbM family methyltransferase
MLAKLKRSKRRLDASIRKRLFSPAGWLAGQVHLPAVGVSRLGTDYGGWTVVQDPHLRNSWAVLCGAGEDISFDLALQAAYQCNILIVDPTPRAVDHFQRVLSSAQKGTKAAINNSTTEFYDLTNLDLSRVHFLPVAVWTEKTLIKFWEPLERSHVSHSITNFQRTKKYIEVEAEPLSHIIGRFALSNDDIHLVKLDIEGAAAEVIDWMCDNAFRPKQLLVEFDEMTFPDPNTLPRVKKVTSRLHAAGYELSYFDGHANCTFLRIC